jgi:hypothetical protein
MVHDRSQKEPKVMVSSQSTQEKSLVAIETDASGALICWLMLVTRRARYAASKMFTHGSGQEFQKTLDRSKRTHLAALPLRTMHSNASCSCRPCKPETKARNRQASLQTKTSQENLSCSRNRTYLSIHGLPDGLLNFTGTILLLQWDQQEYRRYKIKRWKRLSVRTKQPARRIYRSNQ